MRKETYFSEDGLDLEQLASKILEMHLEGPLPPAMERKVLEWIARNRDRYPNEHALEKAWHRHVKYNPHPGKEAYRMYEQLAERLDFPPKERKLFDRYLWRRSALRIAAVLVPLLILGGVAYVRLAEKSQNGLVAERQDKEELFMEEAGKMEDAVTLAVPVGQKESVLLPDNTYVLLNEGATIVYDDDNRVYLCGEGFFRAPKRTEEPLTVKTPYMNVTVLGTTFNVDAKAGYAVNTVSLYTGRVNVRTGETSRLLQPQTQLLYDKTTGDVRVRPVEGSLPEWVAQGLAFHAEPISEIFDTLGWYYNVSFRLEGDVDTDQAFTFTMNGGETLEEILGMMKKVGAEFTYRIADDTVYIG